MCILLHGNPILNKPHRNIKISIQNNSLCRRLTCYLRALLNNFALFFPKNICICKFSNLQYFYIKLQKKKEDMTFL